MSRRDPHGVEQTIGTAQGDFTYYSLTRLAGAHGADPARLPHTVKILLENILRRAGSRDVTDEDLSGLARWPESEGAKVAFMPGRILMQDFTGVPAVVDLAAL
ncbi:MAG: aconitate hydratase, partial [Actinomycetota bacterium]